MNKLHSLLSEAEKSFDEKFSLRQSDSSLVVTGEPIEIKDFYRTTLKQALQAILEAAPKDKTKDTQVDFLKHYEHYKGFNLGREQSLSIIKEYLRGEE